MKRKSADSNPEKLNAPGTLDGKGRETNYALRMMTASILLVLLFIVSFLLGRYPITPAELFGMLGDNILSLFGSGTDQFWTDQTEAVFFSVRLPRILLACMVGCCISAAGAAYQGTFQNPMAAPDILGASSGAAFGAALAILLRFPYWGIMASAFAFSIITVALVMMVSKFSGTSRVLGLILGGIIISSLFTAGTSFIKLVADPNDQLPQITYWLMGSLAESKMSQVGFVCIPMLLGIIPLVLLRWRINILTLGDAEASSMGVDSKRVRAIVIFCATLITAASVSVSGMIGWVGLVVPHLARRLIGNNYMRLLPMTMVIGALFLLGVDDISRNLMATEIPLGILTSLVGAPFFLYLLTRKGEVL